jgi:hypothetical protein
MNLLAAESLHVRRQSMGLVGPVLGYHVAITHLACFCYVH